MRKNLFFLTILVTLCTFVFVGNAFSDVVVIKNKEGKVPFVEKKEDIKMNKIGMVGGDKPENKSEGWTYGTYTEFANGKIKINKIALEPRGKIGTHQGGDYVCYVVEGEGDLILVGPDKTDVGKFHYKPGDVMVFEPDTLHYWVNGDKATVMIGVQPVAK